MSRVEGNYGCWGICDLVLGTSLSSDVVEDLSDEAEQKEVLTKPQRKAKAAPRRGRKRNI